MATNAPCTQTIVSRVDHLARRSRACLLALAASLLLAPSAYPQQYVEYPQHQGKAQPLELKWVPSWATLDMDLRERTEAQTALNYLPGNLQIYDLTRVRGGLAVRPLPWATGYIQFSDNHVPGLPSKYVAANMRDQFDVRQAYVLLHREQATLIVGRQELKYGGERLLGISDWTNNSRTFDGILGRFGEKNRVDLFTSSVVVVHPTSLDTHGAGLTFHGAVGTLQTWVPHTTFQPFVFVKALPRVSSQQAIFGTETEVTPGAEVVGSLMGGIDYDGLAALQRGSYSNNSISAAAAYIKAGYSAHRLPWRPRLRGEYDYASGNPHTNPQRHGTFDQQYPSNHNAFGLTDLFGYQNIKEDRINLDLNPIRRLTLLIQEDWLQVASTHDNVYTGSAGTLIKAPAAGFKSADIGREFDASAKYLCTESLVLAVGSGHFSPGTLMRQNAHGAPNTLAYLSLTYRWVSVPRKSATP
jgi:alginate export protein